jgi:hypothetical protein
VTLLRDLIVIPEAVGPADFVVRAAEGADLRNYVVTDQLAEAFEQALALVRHGITSGRSQAKFLHGSFGSGKSHFMAVLRELLAMNPDARAVAGLGRAALSTDSWLPGKTILPLTLHMLNADSVEQVLFEGYLAYCVAKHPDAPPPAVHRSDALISDAARLRARMGDDAFFAALRDSGVEPGKSGSSAGIGLAGYLAAEAGWNAQTFAEAAAQPPGAEQRDSLVSALTVSFFTGAVRSGQYLDIDTGLAVITRHAQQLGYSGIVLFLDEFILWLSTMITETDRVNTEGAKLNKLVESSDAARPIPIISFVAQQRLLTEFFGDQVAGTDRETISNIMRSAQGRLGRIELADTNLPLITEKRILRPIDAQAKQTIDVAFQAVRNNREVWDILLLGAQYGDAGIGSDAAAFRRLYPFSPALVATLVALSQALQRERTALKVMTELLSARRDTLRVNDLIGAAALFGPLVLQGEPPESPELKQKFQGARATYQKLRMLALEQHSIGETEAAGHEQFGIDDALIRTVLLGALVPDVPALHNLTAAKLHALNFGSITSPLPGYESHIVLDRLRRLAADAGELRISGDADPVISAKLTTVDYDRLLDLVPGREETSSAVQLLVRDLVGEELGFNVTDVLDEMQVLRPWRGRNHIFQVKFGNVRDRVTLPDDAVRATGETWRIVIDYPMDEATFTRRDDKDRIDSLDRKSRTVFWLPLFLTSDMRTRARLLVKINYLLATPAAGNRLDALAADWSAADRQQGRIYLQQRQQQLRETLISALRQAYGVSAPTASDVEGDDPIGILHSLVDGLTLGTPRGGTLEAAFHNLTGTLLGEAYPGEPHLADDERQLTKGELAKVLGYAQLASLDSAKAVSVSTSADQQVLRRICNRLKLGEIADNRYALNLSTCWWSNYLTQGAAQHGGHTERLPVRMLRALMQDPQRHWGFDRDLQNLILLVFAYEQQLGWYSGSARVEVTAVGQVSDEYELRHPPMPSVAEWQDANRRVQGLFGIVGQANLIPATVTLLATDVRKQARDLRADVQELVALLTRHGKILGIDESASAGRLATARRTADLLTELANETDDVVLVRTVAQARLGEIDDQAAGASIKQARSVCRALSEVGWELFELAADRAAGEEPFAVLLEKLRDVAGREQLAADLQEALRVAQQEITRLVRIPTTGAVSPGGTVVTDGAGTGQIPFSPTARTVQVADVVALQAVFDEIEKELMAGRKAKITWEIG